MSCKFQTSVTLTLSTPPHTGQPVLGPPTAGVPALTVLSKPCTHYTHTPQVSQDWDRRLLVSLLQQQLMPGSALNPCGDTTLPSVDELMPGVQKQLSGGVMVEIFQLENVM